MIYELLYKKYSLMMKDVLEDNLMSRDEFFSFVKERLKDLHYVEVEHKGQKGFLYYEEWKEDAKKQYLVSPFGYYAENEQVMVKLFQKWSEEVVKDGEYEFSINLYAKDFECLRAFQMMQFGIMSEICIKRLEDKDYYSNEFEIKVLEKEDIKHNWAEIWKAVNNIVKHLQEAPIFYPGIEFSEAVYAEYFMSDDLELIAAYKDDKIAGIIEWNKEKNELISNSINSVNVGEVFVYQEYRGIGLAEKLLRYAEKRALEKGFQYMWVQHGTANPNARGFWNKYFKTYQYELVRSIKR